MVSASLLWRPYLGKGAAHGSYIGQLEQLLSIGEPQSPEGGDLARATAGKTSGQLHKQVLDGLRHVYGRLKHFTPGSCHLSPSLAQLPARPDLQPQVIWFYVSWFTPASNDCELRGTC